MMTGSYLPGGLATPATLVFADRLDRNLAGMAAFAAGSGMALRPHAKTHKCRQIARRQLALGARGLTVATIGEAEILASRGGAGQAGPEVEDIFIAYPLWPARDLVTRLGDLAGRVRVTVGTDSAAAAGRLAPLAGRVRAMVEVDCGLGRSGVLPADAAGIARAAQRAGLEVSGVFTFPGHSYGPGAAAAAAADEAAALGEAAAALAAAGFGSVERSGGSTPSARLASPGALSELRPGVYALNDAQQVELGVVSMSEVALMVAATVVSRPAPGRIVLDAGAKVLGPDRPAWASGYGRLADWPDARITGLWEHHAVVAVDGDAPALGEVVAVVPNHVCTAVNLVPELLVADRGQVVDRWPVAARAANR
ncbi:MAG TPA: alanine racemase [Streptosporangiaceae bacterium]|nr:alanine racemase [Streptosporangiaceae bacterium]